MKTVETTLYRYNELTVLSREIAEREYQGQTFLNTILKLDEVWFSYGGLIHTVFNV